MAKKTSIVAELEDFLDEQVDGKPYAWGLKFDACNESAWGVEVRITLNPYDSERPDVSQVFLLGGFEGPEECAREIFPYIRKFFSDLEKASANNGDQMNARSVNKLGEICHR